MKVRMARPVALLLAVALAVCLCACDTQTPQPEASSQPSAAQSAEPDANAGQNYADGSRAVFVYMCGSNLESKSGAATKNIAEMLSVSLPENTALIIQTGGARAWRDYDIPADKSCRYRVENDALTLLAESESVNMGLSSSLSDFLLWGTENYPAEHNIAVLWDHGGGSMGGVCYDELHNNDALTLAELETALAATQSALGRKLDMVGFDACLMATLDTAAAAAPYTEYMLASEETEPSGGWDYAAFLGAIADDPEADVPALGKAICDSYKSKSERAGKGDFITLSLIDLGKIDAAVSAFDALCADMTVDLTSRGSYPAIRAAGRAEAYGGATVAEGYSNLVDASGFADGLAEHYGKAAALTSAIDGAVVYSASGSARANAKGLSLFFPQNYTPGSLEQYLNICGLEGYRAYLNEVYGNIPDATVELADAGSIAADGGFQIRLTGESVKYVASVDFLLLEMTGQDIAQTIKGLGQDNDIATSDDGTTYNSNFRGIWLALNGRKLSSAPIDEGADYVLFTAPILLNGTRTNLRFSYTWDESHPDGGYYKALGTWGGIGADGMADKDILPLKEGDAVTVLHNEVNAGDYTSSFENGETFAVGADGGVISEQPLTQLHYQYVYKIKDVFGNVFYSSTAVFEMKYTYAELLDNPLPDGTYAAEVIVISNDVDNGLVYGEQ